LTGSSSSHSPGTGAAPDSPTDWFGEGVAERYDDDGEMFSPEVVGPAVDFLAELAGDGSALEFAIGTGRIALPLAARGVPVQGTDLSEAMVAQLRSKPGGADIPVAIGDYATTRVDGEFSLVYVVFNTIGNLTTQDWQVAAFENAAAHLRPGGCFVVEVGVGGVHGVRPGEPFRVFDVSDTHVGIDEFDTATQGLISHHFSLIDGVWQRASVPFRYAFPAEYDLMARIAGMRLRERWGGWKREPFTAESTKHVSVWEKL
jgi:SAM-dependent methyltransferase